MSTSKKDYEAIAKIIKMVTTQGGMIDRDALIGELSDYFIRENPNFDRDKFHSECCRKGEQIMATVTEIQVCGGSIYKMLSDACLEYLQNVAEGTDRAKINFSITLSNGIVKHITIRQEDDRVVAYGDFEGLL